MSTLLSQTADSIRSDSLQTNNAANDLELNGEPQENNQTEELRIVGISAEAQAAFNNFSDLHISYYGTTQNCKAFNIYCFKYRRTWFLIANQEMKITFFTLRPPRIESTNIVSGSSFLLDGLGKAYANQYTKLKRRRKVVKDLEIYGFYKFNRPGRKSVKGLLFLEYPEIDPGPPWPFKWAAGKAEEKAAEKVDQAKGIIPEINTETLESAAEEAIPEL
jgi:hypothetical protein